MLDVHPPHAPTHTWKDFFIHIATITIGLLIAIGLEQTVEAIQRHNERAELRESLQHESEQVLLDTARVETAITAEIEWQNQLGNVFIASARTHQPLGAIPPLPNVDFDIPDDPIYNAAKAGAKFPLLTPREAEAYNELDGLLLKAELAYQQRLEAINNQNETMAQLAFSQPELTSRSHNISNPRMKLDFLSGLRLSPDELRQLHRGTVHVEVAEGGFRYWSRQVRGAALALSHGERDLLKLQAAERQFNNLP
jgi:hypothetical protein